MNRAPLSYWTAALQFAVAIIFMFGYFALLALLFLGKTIIPDNLLELAKTLALGLTNALGLLFAFLYLRSRVDSDPDPTVTTVKETKETVTTPSKPAASPSPASVAMQEEIVREEGKETRKEVREEGQETRKEVREVREEIPKP